jgi:hypothetical protein
MEVDPINWFSCAVVNFLGLALADDVYEGLSEFFSSGHNLCPTQNSFHFPLKSSKESLSVCRAPPKRHLDDVASTRIMTSQLLWTYLSNLGIRCGYKDKITAYAFRRGCGNALGTIAPVIIWLVLTLDS